MNVFVIYLQMKLLILSLSADKTCLRCHTINTGLVQVGVTFVEVSLPVNRKDECYAMITL